MSVIRLDVGTLAKPVRLDNGFLRVDAHVTRAGVLTYRNPDGSLRREYRPDTEVFSKESLDSMQLKPVTDEHPPKLLTAANASSYQRGSVGERVRRDGDKVALSMLVTDAGLIEKMDSGESRECSCGYTCDVEDGAGVSPEGERYDCTQRNIRYNHVAVLPRGRAGSQVRVHMDGAELPVIFTDSPKPRVDQANREGTTVKVRIDGIEYEAGSEAALQAQAKLDAAVSLVLKQRTDEAELAKKTASETQAKLDAAAAELEKLKKDAAELPAKLAAQMKARSELEARARKVLGSKVSLDGVDDKALRLKVLAKLLPDFKADGKDEAYLAARFDAELERFDRDERDDAFPPKKGGEDDDEEDDKMDGAERLDADEVRADFMKKARELWKRPVGAHLDNSGHLLIAK